MPRTILGKVSLTPKGEYSPDTAYTVLDVVNYGGSSWMALKDVTGVAPAEGENWMLLAQKGDQGEQGIQGIQGIQGETGGPGPTGPQGASFTRLEKTAGTGAPGTTDTYTAYNSEGQAAGTVQVYNGMDGTGAGDFKADGTVPMTGNLQMAQHKIIGVAAATEDGDAVNKGQMDDGLAGKADLTLSNLSNYQKALRNIGGRPNRNFLDNACFAGGGSQQGGGQLPINQRGQTSYPSMTHAMDRWIASLVELQSDGVYFSAVNAYMTQKLEQALKNFLEGKNVTASVLLSDNSLITGSLVYEQSPQNQKYFAAGNVHLVVDTEGNIVICAAQAAKAVAAKLELGTTQTLAYQDEEGNWQLFEKPDYGEELAKCKRYLQMINTRMLGVGFKEPGNGGVWMSFGFPVEMRVNPTVTVKMLPQFAYGDVTATGTVWTAQTSIGMSCSFALPEGNGITDYRACVAQNTGIVFELSAEL